MTKLWEHDALAKARSLSTNCSDFIYGASEYIASGRGNDSVQVADVETVLEFLRANSAGEIKADENLDDNVSAQETGLR
jgi:phage host-nuclease inhibitor protein Gam